MRLAFLIVAAVAFAQTARAEDAKSMTTAEVLEQAKVAASVTYKSAQFVGRFERWTTAQRRGKLVRKGQFVGVYAEPKLRVDFDFSINKPITQPIDDPTGGHMGRITILNVGTTIELLRIENESAIKVDTKTSRNACTYAGFPFASPLLDKVFEPARSVLLNDSLPKTTLAPDGAEFVGKLADANKSRMEFTIDPAAGFHLTRFQHRGPNGEFIIDVTADWKRTPNGDWYVRKLQSGFAECTILSFRPNVEIEPKLFDPNSLATPLELIPAAAD